MRILIGVCFLILITILGYLYAQKYEKRYKYYLSFECFNKRIINETYFSQKTIKTILETFNDKDDFYNVVFQYFKHKKININFNYLTRDDSAFISSYLTSIGECDRDTQIKFVNVSQDEIKEKVKLCLDEKKKYYQLYIKLGFLIGLIVFIMFI